VAQPKSAAQSLYPHLPSGDRPEVKQREPKSLAEAMYPAQSRDQRTWDRINEENRQTLLRNLREASGRSR
jgi:hypothetical protein